MSSGTAVNCVSRPPLDPISWWLAKSVALCAHKPVTSELCVYCPREVDSTYLRSNLTDYTGAASHPASGGRKEDNPDSIAST